MSEAEVHPDLRRALSRAPDFVLRRWRLRRQQHRLSAGMLSLPPLPEVAIEDLHAGTVRLRRYRPEGATDGRALLWMHGGGLVLGQPEQDDLLCSRLAVLLNCAVWSVEYRRAPQHRYPAALDDCHTAFSHVAETTPELALAGESAGGGLAMALALRRRAAGGRQPAALALLYPMLDDRTAADRQQDHPRHAVWNNLSNRTAWRAYLGRRPGRAGVPALAAPARARDLSGLPPVWIACGDRDLFHTENAALVRRLQEAGGEAELVSIPGAFHGFVALAPHAPLTLSLLEAQAAFLRRNFRGV